MNKPKTFVVEYIRTELIRITVQRVREETAEELTKRVLAIRNTVAHGGLAPNGVIVEYVRTGWECPLAVLPTTIEFAKMTVDVKG